MNFDSNDQEEVLISNYYCCCSFIDYLRKRQQHCLAVAFSFDFRSNGVVEASSALIGDSLSVPKIFQNLRVESDASSIAFSNYFEDQ